MRLVENFEQWNDEMSRKYNIDIYRAQSHWFIRWVESVRDRLILKELDVGPLDHVIDLGCGAGHLLSKIGSGRLTGVDLSDFSLGLAKQRLGNQAELIKGDVAALPACVSDRKFDKIACSEVLEHVPDPEKVIEEMVSIAKPNSIMVISVPNEKLIDFMKGIFIRLGIFKFLFPTIPQRNTDEWHLWDFNKALFERVIAGKLVIARTKRVPSHLLPLRFVFVCKRAL